MSQELIESRWDETKTALLEGLSGNRRTTMSMVLENTKINFYKVYVAEHLGKESLQIFHAIALVPIPKTQKEFNNEIHCK